MHPLTRGSSPDHSQNRQTPMAAPAEPFSCPISPGFGPESPNRAPPGAPVSRDPGYGQGEAFRGGCQFLLDRSKRPGEGVIVRSVDEDVPSRRKPP